MDADVTASSGDGRGIPAPYIVAAVEVEMEEPELPAIDEIVSEIDPEVNPLV